MHAKEHKGFLIESDSGEFSVKRLHYAAGLASGSYRKYRQSSGVLAFLDSEQAAIDYIDWMLSR